MAVVRGRSRADLFRPAGTLTDGPDPVSVDPIEAGWDYCGLRALSFTGGQTRTLQTGDNEAVLVPLSGSFRLEADDDMFELDGREEDVFAAVTDVIYPAEVDRRADRPGWGELAMATAPANQGPAQTVRRCRDRHRDPRQWNGHAAGEQPALRRRRPRRADNRCRGADTGRELVIVAASQARRMVGL